MRSDQEIQLEKILGHAQNAYGFVEGIDVRAFHNDLMRRSAVIGQLIALGMACRRLPNKTKAELPDVRWNRIEAMSDALVRNYDDVDAVMIWETATQEMPNVMQAVRSCLGRNT